MGGNPPYSTLQSVIVKELDRMKKLEITPFFVFNGFGLTRKDKPFSSEDTRPTKRAAAWNAYHTGRTDSAFTGWNSSNSVNQNEYLQIVFKILADNGVEFMRAPFSALAQLAYLEKHPRGLIHAICGGSELLLWDVDRVILNMDFDGGNFQWLDKGRVMSDLQVDREAFLDICLLAGFDWIPTFPPLISAGTGYDASAGGFTFKGTVDMVHEHGTGYNAVIAHSADNRVVKGNYVDSFSRTRCAVKYHLVLTDEGKVEPLNKEAAPSDIHEFIGFRLPDEVYFYLSQGMVSSQVINNLTSGMLLESPPLDNGETEEYRSFLNSKELIQFRTQSLSLLSWGLHKFYQSRKVASIYWFEPSVEHVMQHHSELPIAAKWNIHLDAKKKDDAKNYIATTTASWVGEELKRQKVSTVDLRFVLKSLENVSKSATTTGLSFKSPATQSDMLAMILSRFYELRQFVSSSTNALTGYGKSIVKSLSTVSGNAEELMVAVELLRLKQLHGKLYSKVYTPVPEQSEQQQQQVYSASQPNATDAVSGHIRLISRVASLLSAKTKAMQPWAGGFNRDLLVFNSFVRSIHRSCRNLCEMLLLSMVLNDGVIKSTSASASPDEGVVVEEQKLNHAINVCFSLPFFLESSTALGILVMQYLEKLVSLETNESKSVAESVSIATEAVVAQNQGHCEDVRGDLKRGFVFFEQVVEMVKVLGTEKLVDEEVKGGFVKAEEWVRARRVK